jgi:hypothetical protein
METKMAFLAESPVTKRVLTATTAVTERSWRDSSFSMSMSPLQFVVTLLHVFGRLDMKNCCMAGW